MAATGRPDIQKQIKENRTGSCKIGVTCCRSLHVKRQAAAFWTSCRLLPPLCMCPPHLKHDRPPNLKCYTGYANIDFQLSDLLTATNKLLLCHSGRSVFFPPSETEIYALVYKENLPLSYGKRSWKKCLSICFSDLLSVCVSTEVPSMVLIFLNSWYICSSCKQMLEVWELMVSNHFPHSRKNRVSHRKGF